MTDETLPFPQSRCHGCAHKRDVVTARARFLRCTALEVKYPPQPVRQCEAFVAASPGT